MGLDLQTFPVRLDSTPMRILRSDAQAWEDAVDHPPFCNLPSDSLPEISLQLLASFPNGLGLNYPFPDRSHEQAEYLLDPVGFRALTDWAERERSLPYRIIQGDRVFADHAASGQGMRWRCSTAAFLAEAAAAIAAIDVAAAHREFSVAEMATLGIYKVHDTQGDDEYFERVLGGMERLARYYRQVANDGMDLILTLC
jgi:hypothetical protein